MEFSLHRELKALYAGSEAATEVRLGRFRIDAVRDDELIEIQLASLAALRRKTLALLADPRWRRRRLRIVKPVVASKQIIRRRRPEGPVASRRRSPKRGALVDVFHELIYFTRVFPRPRLALDVLLVDVEEERHPGHGRRRRWRRRDHVVADQRLVAVGPRVELATADDLWRLVPGTLPEVFHSGDVAEATGLARWVAQRIVFCLREMGAAEAVGKHGNTRLYRRAAGPTRDAAA